MKLNMEDIKEAYRNIERTIESLEAETSEFSAHYWWGHGMGLLEAYSNSDLMSNAEREEFEQVLSAAHNQACYRAYRAKEVAS